MRFNNIMRLIDLYENQDDYYNTIVEKAKAALGISSNVTVGFDLPSSHFAQGQGGATFMKDGKIQIFINPEGDAVVRAIAHEMVHAKQLDDGRLKMDFTDGIKMYWEGKEVPAKYNRNSPWELEAHNGEREIFNQITN